MFTNSGIQTQSGGGNLIDLIAGVVGGVINAVIGALVGLIAQTLAVIIILIALLIGASFYLNKGEDNSYGFHPKEMIETITKWPKK